MKLPLVICLHGAGFNRLYFDLPGHSLLSRAEANGFAAMALDRPGYGESEVLPVEDDWFPAQAEALDATIATVWAERGADRPGIVLVGHSFGATIAMRIAARSPSWPLLGLVIGGSLDRAPQQMLEFAAGIADAPPHAPIALEPPMVRSFFYGPDGSFDAAALDQAAASVAPAPALEIREWAARWIEDAPAIAAAIDVPVQIRVAENDAVLDVSNESLARFSSLFTAAPSVDAELIPNCGHNADHHHPGTALHLEQLAFAAAVAT